MIRIAYRNGKSAFRLDATVAELPALIQQCSGRDDMLWVDLFEPYDDKSERVPLQEVDHLLREVFAFHYLAVDDALTESHVPKLDDWGDYLYIVLHAVVFDRNLDEIDTRELDVFLGKHYIVTYHHEEVPALEREWNSLPVDDRHGRRGPDYLLYHLCDAIATDYLPCMDTIDDVVDTIQDQVFEEPTPRLVARVLKLKQAVLNLRRILSPQREVLSKLARDNYAIIDAKDRIYFRDVYDHFVRLVDLNESSRDIISGALDTYLSVTANRTNEVVKTLTIITTLFMPLSFITGFFGMNFFGGTYEVPAGFNPAILFILMMASVIFVPLIMVMYIRRRGWW